MVEGRAGRYRPAVTLKAEFTVEPFHVGEPGPHVQAAYDAATAVGLAVEFGPFGTVVEGDDELVIETLGSVLRAGVAHGATASP